MYLDTGMGRMGMPCHRALPWLKELSARDNIRLHGRSGNAENAARERVRLPRGVLGLKSSLALPASGHSRADANRSLVHPVVVR